MNKKLSLLCLTLLFSPVFLFAQGNFRAASIVKMNGDTISGFINYQGWSQSPTDIQFKKSLADTQVETLNTGTIKGFSVNGVEDYVSYVGPVSVNKIEGDGIAYLRDSTVKVVSVFLRVIISGSKVALLAHRDEIKTAYFVMERNSNPQELKFYRYYNDNDRMVTSAPFRQVLISLLEKYRGVNEKWFKEVGVADYSLSALTRLVNSINNNESKETSISGSRFFVGAAAMYQHITFDGPERYRYQRASNNIAPVFNIGYDFYANKFVPKTIFRVEAGVSRISPSFEGPYSIFILKAVLVSVKTHVLYSFNTAHKLKPFIGAGVGVNVPIQSENRLIANPKAIPWPGTQTILINGDTRGSLQVGQSINQPYLNLTVFVNPEFKAGLTFDKKLEAVATANLIGTNMLKSALPVFMSYYSLGLNYYFGAK